MLAAARLLSPREPQLDHLGRDVAALLAEREREHRHLRVDPVRGTRLREEQDPARRMALAEPRERLDGDLLPLARHPGEVRHHARPQVGAVGLVRRLLAQAAERLDDVRDLDVLARPLDCVNGRAQCRSHSLPSWPISSSEPAGPHVPAA